MKANALEKIYLFENPISGTHDDRWLSKRSDENDIEYTRTDAFIEKAVKWIRENWREHVWLTDNDIIHFGLWENDFCRAMKGE